MTTLDLDDVARLVERFRVAREFNNDFHMSDDEFRTIESCLQFTLQVLSTKVGVLADGP